MGKLNYLLVFLFCWQLHYACQCPVIQWTPEVANEYDVIARVVIKKIIPHQNHFLVAEVEVLNLFKGNAYKNYKVLFPENDECAVPVNEGEEWIIYAKSKQINSCQVDWCGLSRKKFVNDAEDFFIATHIITYDEELEKLKQHFPEIKVSEDTSYAFHKNILPDRFELYIYLALSVIGFLLFLFIAKKYLK
jgi:hypothetical protein